MKILIAGSNGMVGSAVTRHLIRSGHTVVRLVRQAPGSDAVWWDPQVDRIDRAGIEGFDGVVHVATRPWSMRWTAQFKKEIYANRIGTSRLLAEALARCKHKPRVLICGSGVGIYPSSGDRIITEEHAIGSSFLAHLQRDGEAAAAPASEAGIRVVHLRIPAVMGAVNIRRDTLQYGDGRQWMSWIGLGELARIVQYALETETLVGPVNAVSPCPLRDADFAATLASALRRKPRRLPTFLLHLLLGEMGDEFVFASRRTQPRKLLLSGYQFRFPELGQAVQHELGEVEA